MTASRSRPDESLARFETTFPDDVSCLKWMFDARYGKGPNCRKCGKSAEWGKILGRHFRTKCCYDNLSPGSRTFLHKMRSSPRKCFYGMYLTSILDGKLTARFLMRHLGLSTLAAWRLSDRIRAHMTLLSLASRRPYGDKVYVDEMQIRTLARGTGRHVRRTVVLGITDGIRPSFYCVPDRKGSTLCSIIERNVAPGATIVVDGFHGYEQLERRGYCRSTIIHSKGQWKNAAGDSNSHIENCWREVRRRLERVHRHVDTKHLWKYLGQLQFILECRSQGRSPFWEAVKTFPEYTSATLAAAQASIVLR